MPFIPVNLNEVEEAKPVPLGRYDVTIESAEEGLTKGGDGKEQKPQIICVVGIEGHDEAPRIFHRIGIPSMSDKDGGKFQTLLLARFMHAFKVPIDPAGVDTEKLAMELPGKRANLELIQSVFNDVTRNELKIPPLKDEKLAGAGRGSPPPKRRFFERK